MKLHTKIVLSLILGASAGGAANALAPGAAWIQWINEYVAGPVGQIFLRLLLMTVVPLVFASLTLGVAGIGDIAKLSRIGLKTLAYFALSTSLSVLIGLALVNAVRPGEGIDPAMRQSLLEAYRSQAEGLQPATSFGVSTFVNIVPRNPVQSAASMDMLGVIFFSLVFGAALTLIPQEKAAPVLRFMEGLGEAIAAMIGFAMRLAPYGVFGLIFVVTSRFGWGILQQLSVYVAVVLIGLLLHAALGLSLLVRLLGGWNPLLFWKRIRASIVTGFSTSSSNATLPTNLAVAEGQLGIPASVARFVLPLGATLNMNGTALFEGVTVLFLAQVFGVPLGLGLQAAVLVLCVLTAIGTAGVPGGSLPLLMVVMGSVGVPPEGIAIILGVDRILDMSRTTLNVAGDLTAALFIARSERLGSAQGQPQNA